MKQKLFVLYCLLSGLYLQAQELPSDKLYGTGTWDADSLGNHRVVVVVDKPADAVLATVEWRRKDLDLQNKNLIVVDSASGNLLSAIALRESGESAKADALVASWQSDYPDNRIAQWCTAVYRGEREKAAGILKARHDQIDTTPWETSARDVDFDLIVRLFQ